MSKLITIAAIASIAGAANAGTSGSLETFADSNINGDAPSSASTLGSGRTWTVRSSGVVTGNTGIRFMPVQGPASGAFAGWALIEFDPTEALAAIEADLGTSNFVITGATFVAQQQDSQPFSVVAGDLDLYHIADDTTSAAGLSGASFTNQLSGATLAVDNYNYIPQASANFLFDSGDSVDYSAVLADWNDGADLIRMALDADGGSAVAAFKGSSSPFGGINAPSFRLTYEVVPAPGAAALFGLAGLTASRRRRG